MRIAFFCDSYKPYISGVTNSVELLVKELRELGHRVYIFAPRYPKHVDTDPDIIRFPSLPTSYPNFRLALPYTGRIPEVDLVHTHSPFQVGMLARHVAKKRKLPLIYTFHTLFTRYVHYARIFPEPLSKLAMARYLQNFCASADLIIAPSKMARRTLRAWKVPGKIEVVPSGVDLSEVHKINAGKARETFRKKFKIPLTAQVLLYVGRISEEKNLKFLLKAFRKLSQDSRLMAQGSGPHLVLVGKGPLEEKLKKEKAKNVVMAGEVDYPGVLSCYFAGDLFVFASLTETQGLVLAEAKAAGLPVVALFAGGLADTVRSGIDGYLTPRKLEDFTAHVLRLLKDPGLRSKMGAQAAEDARERFSSKAVAKKMEMLYNGIAKAI